MIITKALSSRRIPERPRGAGRLGGALSAVVVLALFVAACGSNDNEAGPSAAADGECKLEYAIGSESADRLNYREFAGDIDLGGESPRIGVVLKTLSNEYWAEVKRGAEAAGAFHDVEVVVQQATDEASESEQLTVARTMVSQGFDAYVIAPITNANLTPAINQIRDECKPLVEVIEPGVVTNTYVGTDERDVGYQAAEYLAKVLPDGAPVLHIEGQAGSVAGEQRTEGFTKGAEKFGLKLLGNGVANWDQTQAFNATNQLLERFPKTAGIYAANDTMALGVAEAMRKRGLDVAVVGTDAIPAAVGLIRKGRMDATGTPFPYYQGCKAVEAALHILAGEKVPAWVDTPPTLVTSDNVDDLFDANGAVTDSGSCQPPE